MFFKGIRPDARTFNAARELEYGVGAISSADGSSTVKIGGTSVVAGSKLHALMLPITAVAHERKGTIKVSVELGPLCSTRFQSYKNSEQAVTLSKSISRIVSEMFDFQDLRINDNLVWDLRVTVICTSFDGNVMDAAVLAAVLCLINTKIPDVIVSSQGELSETEKAGRQLTVKSIPVSLTFSVFDLDRQLIDLVDPTALEEDAGKSLLTIVVMAKNSGQDTLSQLDSAPVLVLKPGGIALPASHLSSAIRSARVRAKAVLALLLQDLL